VADRLACRRGERLIFSDLSFSLGAGEALIVTGRNGAGKSSLIAILAGLLRPEAGTAAVAGGDGGPVGEQVSLIGHRDGLKPALTAAENLAFAQAMLGLEAATPLAALAAVGLAHVAHLPVAYLSAGQKRRVALARLIVSHRPIWLLDEPAAALDGTARGMLTRLMAGHLSRGGLIVAATHEPLGLDGVRELTLARPPRASGIEPVGREHPAPASGASDAGAGDRP